MLYGQKLMVGHIELLIRIYYVGLMGEDWAKGGLKIGNLTR
jgi:hypothetical protein